MGALTLGLKMDHMDEVQTQCELGNDMAMCTQSMNF